MGIYCKNCGMSNSDDARFCSNCGLSLTSSELSAGTMLDYNRYKVLKPISSGGMGAIYLAEDTRLGNKKCAIKELLDCFNTPQERKKAIKRFEREALILSSIKHKSIPEVHNHFFATGRYYLVMDYIEGLNLEEIMIQLLPRLLPEKQILQWGIEICHILEYLHNQKPEPIIHRDIKPANFIQRVPDGRIILVDFGIARLFAPEKKATIIGTPGYAPPEQYRGEAGPCSDLYSLGATLHHLFTGRDPRTDAPFNFPPLKTLRSDISIQTDEVIQKILQSEVKQRYPSAPDFRRALEQALDLKKLEQSGGDSEALPKLELKPQLVNKKTALSLASPGVPSENPTVDFTTKAEKLAFDFSSFETQLTFSSTTLEKKVKEPKRTSEEFEESIPLANKYEDPIVKAEECIEMQKWYEGIRECNRAIALNMNVARAYYLLGSIYHAQGKTQLALEEVRKTIEMEPEDVEALGLLGVIYHGMGRNKEAEEVCKKALSIDPMDARVHALLGVIYHALRKIEQAVNECQRALAIDPDYSDAHSFLAELYLEQNMGDLALEECRIALESDPENTDAYTIMGKIFKKDNPQEAIRFIEKALSIDCKNIEALLLLAEIYRFQGKKEEAIEVYKRALETDPNSEKIHRELAELYNSMDNFHMAASYYEKLIKINDTNAEYYAAFGDIARLQGNLDLAATFYRKAILLDDDPNYHSILASIYRTQGKTDLAIQEFKKVYQAQKRR